MRIEYANLGVTGMIYIMQQNPNFTSASIIEPSGSGHVS